MNNTLTPQLTEEQLKQNIDALHQQNLPLEKVQSYVNNYQKGTDGNYVLKQSQAQPTTATPEKEGGGFGGFVKSIVSPVATTIARPIQAVAELAGVSDDAVNKFSKEKLKGYVAPTPQNGGDVMKDAGRAAETVAFGLSPVAGGAAFGFGNSLEQGHKLLSVQTALETALGAAGGKVLDVIGKPIFNAAGKVIGKVTPEFLTDLASKGTKAIQDFAAHHDILPEFASKAVNKGAEAVEKVANAPFEAAKRLVKGSPEEQAQKALQATIESTMPLGDKNTRIDQLKGGKVTRKGILGKSVAEPTEDDIARGTLAHDYIGGDKDYTTQIPKINQAIGDISEQANAHADAHSAPSNLEDIHKYIEDNMAPDDTIKGDKDAHETYQKITERLKNIVADSMRSTAEKTGDYSAMTSTTPIRGARTGLDTSLRTEFGDKLFGTPQFTGVKAAGVSGRNVLNNLQEDMLRYPGQLEKLNRYNEALRTLQEKNIKIEPEQIDYLKKVFDLKSDGESNAAADQFRKHLSDMHSLYDARENIINKNQSKLGKNKIQEFLKSNPVTRAAASMLTHGATEAAIISPFIH